MYNGYMYITTDALRLSVTIRINVPFLACWQKFRADQNMISISQIFLERNLLNKRQQIYSYGFVLIKKETFQAVKCYVVNFLRRFQQRILHLANFWYENISPRDLSLVLRPQPTIQACLKTAQLFPTPKLRNAHLECQTKLLSTASRFRSAVCVCVRTYIRVI